MTDTQQEHGAEESTQTRGVLLLLAALAVIAVPVFLGYLLLRDNAAPSATDSGTEMADSGMGGGGATDGETAETRPEGVGDFSEIQATDIVVEAGPVAGSAVLTVTTSIDVACAVSYGQTQALGSLATDTDMVGGGHADHHPVLTGLNSDTTYWYQLSGIAEDGSLYQSDLMQFTTGAGSGPVDAIPPPGPNVAGDATVTDVSSEYSDAYAGANAIDGDLSTEWSSAGDGDDAFIVLDFGEDMLVNGVGFRTREMSDGTSITTTFTVTVGGRTHGPFEAGPGLAVALVDFEGQVVRFDVDTSTGGNTGAVEVEVYGEPSM